MDDFFAEGAFVASVACYALAALGCFYALAAIWAANRFVRSVPHRDLTSCPPVTILKPLHGIEPNLYDNLVCFCRQDYPSPVQIVFGVSDLADPAINIVRKIVAEFPDRDIKLVINSRRHGSNRKVSNLINMMSEARHDVLIISDSDISVDPDYVQGIAATLAGSDVGLVTCLYRGVAQTGLWAKFAGAAIDYHFLPSVLVGLMLGLAEPCFGSTIAIRRQTLAAIGGLQTVADQLADDYALGAAVRRAGLRVAIPARVVGHDCTQASALDLFRHELRWARTIRSIDAIGFVGTAVTHALPLALLGLLLGGMNIFALLVPAAFLCRSALQMEFDRAFQLRRRFYWLGPVRDILSFLIFVASFFGRDVEWRGHRYGVQPDNTLACYGEVET